ncbi:MAG: hypothetical protein RL653_1660 [Pseudomonadota bacterium]|jgi:tRNA threonylcarbamoyl adenosine modification protein (Sua5/YciO/YrdC/YwlC family)
MAAPILELDPERPSPRHLQRAVEVLERDGLVAYPTDTYYAVGCSLRSKRGIERLYQLKGRDKKKPLSFLCADLERVADYAKVSNFAYRTMKGLVPGAFTFILPATRFVPDVLQSRQEEVGIRVPDAEIPRALARLLGQPLVTTSATDHEGTVLVDAKEIKQALGNQLELILDDGGMRHLEASTVVSLMNDGIEILRQGKGELDLR